MDEGTFVGGVSIPQRSDDAYYFLDDARSDGYDFITTNLPYSSDETRTDVTLMESKHWSTSIVGMVTSPPLYRTSAETSSGTDNGEALVAALNVDGLRRQAKKDFTFMLQWASHMSIPAVILPPIPADNIFEYGRFLSTLITNTSNVQLWLRVNFDKESIQNFMMIQRMCDGASNLGCIVEFGQNFKLADQIGEGMSLLHQLIGCNLRALVFSTTVFLSNKRKCPTLAKSHQFLFVELLKRLGRTCRILVEGSPHHHITDNEAAMGRSRNKLYLQYLRHIRSKGEVKDVLDTEESKMETSYLDHLQSALQPLGDHLEFSTYEVFEKDPVKYEKYREAVELALLDKIQLKQLKVTSDAKSSVMHCVIMVVGAGRGPLVNASLMAVKNVNKKKSVVGGTTSNITIKPHVIAVEKNPSAVLFLNSLKNNHPDWNGTTSVAECDMRSAEEHPLLSAILKGDCAGKVDIVVSELLGSFGDNELSPECLDGVQRSGLMKESCISIPQSYTSYLAPVTSARLRLEAQTQAFMPLDGTESPAGGKVCGTLQAMETPYVVRAHAASQLHKELPCWEFSHPVKKENAKIEDAVKDIDNERRAQKIFKIDGSKGASFGSGYGNCNETLSTVTSKNIGMESSNLLHGFLGSFHCVLYKSKNSVSSDISIAPESFSTGMFSWFPLYFPLKEPLLVPPGSSVRANIWRKCDDKRVWYEWCADIISEDSQIINISNLHNPNGRSSFVRL
eukprot:CAMPEP_0194072662 /NCGR_PEP_ID=MMETSP0149-20130528/342_1 /TAXON_ID=122233 /ORGANISM="Chaetoceros debilis, Strain MM31A-1" /LENGTH=733 /DNA_ID=CAMNT_0038752563 /DNA_START=93 /DNA_END=2294 /DNA_ORIENTATION=+